MAIHTVKFNKEVTFTDHTGVSFVNTTTAETASLVTSATVSPADVIAYEVTWVTDPVNGDVIEWRYDGLGSYIDDTGDDPVDMESGEINLTNCADLGVIQTFQQYGDSDAILSASLVSAGELNGGVITGAGAGGEVYSDGITLPGNAYVRWVDPLSTGEKDSLTLNGQVTLEVDTPGLSRDVPSGSNEDFGFLNAGTSGTEKGIRRNGLGSLFSLYNASVLGGEARSNSAGKGVKTRLDFTWTTTGGVTTTLFYVDYVLMGAVDSTLPYTAADFAELVVGDRGASLSPGSQLKNFQIVDKYIDTDIYYSKYRHVNFYGDSFIRIGQYPTLYMGIIAQTEDGATGATYDSGDQIADTGIVTRAHAYLNSVGKQVGGNRIKCWHEGGTGVLSQNADLHTLSYRVDISLDGTYDMPTVSVLLIGTNDTTGAPTDAELSDGTFRSAYQAEIDKLLAVGSKVFVCTVPPINVYTAGDTPTLINRDNIINTEINKLSGVTVIDVFTMLGGHDNFDPDDWGSITGGLDDRHPSRQGHAKIGTYIGQIVANNI